MIELQGPAALVQQKEFTIPDTKQENILFNRIRDNTKLAEQISNFVVSIIQRSSNLSGSDDASPYFRMNHREGKEFGSIMERLVEHTPSIVLNPKRRGPSASVYLWRVDTLKPNEHGTVYDIRYVLSDVTTQVCCVVSEYKTGTSRFDKLISLRYYLVNDQSVISDNPKDGGMTVYPICAYYYEDTYFIVQLKNVFTSANKLDLSQLAIAHKIFGILMDACHTNPDIVQYVSPQPDNIAFFNTNDPCRYDYIVSDGVKITGRDGSKGVICVIVDDDKMPVDQYDKCRAVALS